MSTFNSIMANDDIFIDLLLKQLQCNVMVNFKFRETTIFIYFEPVVCNIFMSVSLLIAWPIAGRERPERGRPAELPVFKEGEFCRKYLIHSFIHIYNKYKP